MGKVSRLLVVMGSTAAMIFGSIGPASATTCDAILGDPICAQVSHVVDTAEEAPGAVDYYFEWATDRVVAAGDLVVRTWEQVKCEYLGECS